MSEDTDLHAEGTEGAPVPEAVESEAEATTAQPEAGADDPAPADDAGDEPPKRTPWFQKRIDELTAKRYEAERESAYWRGIAEASRTPEQRPEQQQVPDRWEDPEGYDRWLIKQAATAAREEMKTETAARSYGERENAFRASKPDYDNVARDPSLPVTPLMAEVIWASDKGPELLYHLGSNRSEAERISRLSPPLQAAALGRIEASLSAPPPVQQNRAAPPPAPPKTVSGLSAGLNKSPDDMSMAEYVAWMKERDKQ